jgi:hypothetical protein
MLSSRFDNFATLHSIALLRVSLQQETAVIAFDFRINASFLGYSSHPITVPRSQVEYCEVERLRRLSDDVWITIHGRRPIRGQLYRGTAGFGPYYQVRALDPVRLSGGPVALGARARVRIYFADGRLEVDLTVM